MLKKMIEVPDIGISKPLYIEDYIDKYTTSIVTLDKDCEYDKAKVVLIDLLKIVLRDFKYQEVNLTNIIAMSRVVEKVMLELQRKDVSKDFVFFLESKLEISDKEFIDYSTQDFVVDCTKEESGLVKVNWPDFVVLQEYWILIFKHLWFRHRQGLQRSHEHPRRRCKDPYRKGQNRVKFARIHACGDPNRGRPTR